MAYGTEYCEDKHLAYTMMALPSGRALLDSGCSVSLIGESNVECLRASLKAMSGGSLDFRPWNDAPSMSFKGINGTSPAKYAVKVPIQLGKMFGTMNLYVIEGSAPLLFSSKSLKRLKAIVDYGSDWIWIGIANERLQLEKLDRMATTC